MAGRINGPRREGGHYQSDGGTGNFGDCKSLDGGLFEMRIDVGPGYRVYYAQRGMVVYVLLLGGDKRKQSRDIRRARQMMKQLE